MADAQSLRDFEQQISMRYLQRILRLLPDGPPDAVLTAFQRAGVDYEASRTQQGRFLHFDFYALLNELNRDDCLPGFSLRFGLARELLDLGVLGYTILSAHNVGMAIALLTKYHRLTSRVSDLEVRQYSELTTLRQRVKPDFSRFGVEINEDHITGVLLVLRTLLGEARSSGVIQIKLSHEKPAYADTFHSDLVGQIEYGCGQTSVSIPTALLKEPLQTADTTVEHVCSYQCDRLIGQLSTASGVVDLVRREILAVPPSRSPSLNEVAKALMMSTRTLERRLRDAGTSFRWVDNELRMHLAKKYLDAGYPSIQEIAYLLGYSQPSTFYRAFKNWHNRTPGNYRSEKSMPAGESFS